MCEINENTVLDCGTTFGELRHAYSNSEENNIPKSFNDIFGDLSGSIFVGTLDLSSLNLNSLKGCPTRVKRGGIDIACNPNLKSLDYFPKKLPKDQAFFIDYDLIPVLSSLDIKDYQNLNIYICYKAYLKEALPTMKESLKRVASSLLEFREENGNFDKIHGDIYAPSVKLNPVEVERYYTIYKKVDFDREKFDRAVELL